LVAIPPQRIPQEQLCGFKLRRWRCIGITFRREIARYGERHDRETIVAMMCRFIAAIEQNLLEFGTTAARRAWNKQAVLYSKDLAEYLREALRVTV
jgi:hypothetical protein